MCPVDERGNAHSAYSAHGNHFKEDQVKKFIAIAITLVVGILLGAVMIGTVMAAPATPQATPTPGAGNSYGYGPGYMMGRGGMWGGDVGMEQEVLTFLGMTRDQVIAERQAGKSLVQIAQAQGKTEQQLVDTILAARRADLDALVSQSRLTQAQADQIYQNLQQTVPQAVNSTTVGAGRGNGFMDSGNCPMLNNGQPGNGQTSPSLRGRGGMMGGRFNGPST
jgi:hypothetical protein